MYICFLYMFVVCTFLDIPLLPAIGTMSKGAAPNFVVNWLNNKELQYTLASEMLLQPSKESALVDTRTSGTDTTSQEIGSQESQSEYDGKEYGIIKERFVTDISYL